MLELLTGSGLAVAAGLNAYVPLLGLGLAGRFLPGILLPAGWEWLANDWVLVGLGILLVIEIVADKIPAVDSANDILQTVIRPAAGGIAFGTGSATTTAVVTDPAAFVTSSAWIPVAIGVGLALLTHLAKASVRPVANVATLGLAAPALSAAEDASAVALSLLALLLPILVGFALVGLVLTFVGLRRRIGPRSTSTPTPHPDTEG